MTRIPFPGRKWPQLPQPEVCEICGRPVEHHEIFEAEVEGVEGLRVCIYHGSLVTEPGWRDLREIDTLLSDISGEDVRTDPFGADEWWDADGIGYILREDNINYLYREDSLSGFLRES